MLTLLNLIKKIIGIIIKKYNTIPDSWIKNCKLYPNNSIKLFLKKNKFFSKIGFQLTELKKLPTLKTFSKSFKSLFQIIVCV